MLVLHSLTIAHWKFINTRITPRTISCGIQHTGVVTMVMEVLHNGCNMCIYNHDLPDMYALRPQAYTS